MNVDDLALIRGQLASLLGRGELSLLLGAGFSIENCTKNGHLPNSQGLRDRILDACGRKAGSKTTLKDAYTFGRRELPDFDKFLAGVFTVESVLNWQEAIFYYAWNRIYTTNIDNVLDVAYEQARRVGKASAEYTFFNYTDPGLLSETIGTVPVVTVHGTCRRLQDGFVFSDIEYGIAAAKILDWHRELAARLMAGGLVVVGNQLDESDFDAYIAQRESTYPGETTRPENWLVMPSPDDIKAENYRAAGFHVIDATAKEFFEALFSTEQPKTVADLVIETNPAIRKAATDRKALVWLKSSFSPVLLEMEDAKKQTGILRHFITGSHPDWFYIVHNAHAATNRARELATRLGSLMQAHAVGVGALNVIGPSGSGKTTAIRAALTELVSVYRCMYEFNDATGIEPDLLVSVISSFSEKSILIFYSAAEFFYAINHVINKFSGKSNPFCLFILEDRTSDYKQNHQQLKNDALIPPCVIGELSMDDARSLARKISESGLRFGGFSELPLERQASRIIDKERGYGGDLLSALFSLTTHENFEAKVFDEYYHVKDRRASHALDVVAILDSLGLRVPISYLAGMLDCSVEDVHSHLDNELAGILLYSGKTLQVRCRHRVIASYYFRECIAGHGSVELLLGVLTFLSRQFTVADIRHHPLSYRMYKELISLEFMYNNYFSRESSERDTSAVYHYSQTLFGNDGIFWLQFGRFYRKTERVDDAIDCFRTGLGIYDSFQTRHSLGTTLLEKYLMEGCRNWKLYEEGVEILEVEAAKRGDHDAYPTSTLIEFLSRVLKADPSNRDAEDRLKRCVNYAMRHFRNDQYVMNVVREHFRG